jgi:hypothetical protein
MCTCCMGLSSRAFVKSAPWILLSERSLLQQPMISIHSSISSKWRFCITSQRTGQLQPRVPHLVNTARARTALVRFAWLSTALQPGYIQWQGLRPSSSQSLSR